MKRFDYIILLLGFLLALTPRLASLSGPLDEPMWRQADTSYMALRMMDEFPPDFLHPKAPYRGTNDVKAAEFPIYPALVAMTYKAVGHESLPLARLVTLLLFAGALWFFWATIKLICGARVAVYAALCYSLIPLGIFYSRAINPDYLIICASHALWYAALRFFENRKFRWFLVATVGATLAFLMKAPYAFYFALPVAVWVLWERNAWRPSTFLWMVALSILPILGALWFNHQRIAMESGFTESLIYPMKWTSESLNARFFGTLQQRLNPLYLKHAAKRIFWISATPVGLLLSAFAPFVARSILTYRAKWTVFALCIGVLLYIETVFPMFARAHDYYQLPVLAPVAVLSGVTLSWIRGLRFGRTLVVVALLCLIAVSAWGYFRIGPYVAGGRYGAIDWQRVKAGEAIRSFTSTNDIVLSVTYGRSTGWSDPRILTVANRVGWAIQARDLDDKNLAMFIKEGATVAAVLVTPEEESREEELAPFAAYPRQRIPLDHETEEIGSVRFYRLK